MLPPNTFSFDSIGSRFWLENLDGTAFDRAVTDEVLAYCQHFDDTYSRFKETSLVAQLARTGRLNNPPEDMRRMLQVSKQMYEASEGAFNITVGATLHRLGYGDRAHGGSALADPWEQITWDNASVRSPKGMMLDFGGLGKGWMIDEIAQILRGHGYRRFIVNGGGDLYVNSNTPVEITLEDPHNPTAALRTVQLQNAALAGSNTIKRAWRDGDKVKHHIIDPVREDSSATGVVASYVIAPSALVADIMATILILKPDLKEKLEQQYDFSSMLLF